MTLNGYFLSNLISVPVVLLRAFDFQSPPQKRLKRDAHNQRRNEGE